MRFQMVDIETAMKNYVAKFTGMNKELIYIGFQNRVPLPKSNNYCIITVYNMTRLGTPIERYMSDAMTYYITQHFQANVQIDFYGNTSRENANTMVTTSRTLLGANYLKTYGIQPLYCEEARRIQNVTGERQYEDRYMVDFNIEFDGVLSVEQDGFVEAKINLIKVEL